MTTNLSELQVLALALYDAPCVVRFPSGAGEEWRYTLNHEVAGEPVMEAVYGPVSDAGGSLSEQIVLRLLSDVADAICRYDGDDEADPLDLAESIIGWLDDDGWEPATDVYDADLATWLASHAGVVDDYLAEFGADVARDGIMQTVMAAQCEWLMVIGKEVIRELALAAASLVVDEA